MVLVIHPEQTEGDIKIKGRIILVVETDMRSMSMITTISENLKKKLTEKSAAEEK